MGVDGEFDYTIDTVLEAYEGSAGSRRCRRRWIGSCSAPVSQSLLSRASWRAILYNSSVVMALQKTVRLVVPLCILDSRAISASKLASKFGADEQRKCSASRLKQKRSLLLRRFVAIESAASPSDNSRRAKRDVLAVRTKEAFGEG
jgi:hypothetical protein